MAPVSIVQELKACIEKALQKREKRFAIFPFGDIGMQAKNLLTGAYGIEPEYILDNNLCQYNPHIRPLSILKDAEKDGLVLLLACENPDIYPQLKAIALTYMPENAILELNRMTKIDYSSMTKIGKYSYGPLCNHWLVESVGAFDSFAAGSDVVENHATKYISTHPFLYYGHEHNTAHVKMYDQYQDADWYFPGVKPHGKAHKLRRITIGNDVWLGHNVIITNGANIGNGVIAGAGSIITKDVPDYAIVVGVPARIIRYRFNPEQIAALNRIKWWNWSDKKIREKYEDFYLPIDEFIRINDK